MPNLPNTKPVCFTAEDLHIVTNGGSTYAKVYLRGAEVDQGDTDEVFERVLETLGVTFTLDRDDLSLPDAGPKYDTSLDPCSPDFDFTTHQPEQPAWWHVNAYERGREYGGPEEGGWWFDTGRFDESRSYLVHRTKAEAQESARSHDRQLTETADRIGTPEVGYTSYRGGRFTVRVEAHVGHDFPIERPHYS